MALPALELWLIRHAPTDFSGRLAGRTDVEAVLPGAAALALARTQLQGAGRVVASPAQRTIATARALFPGREIDTDPYLWEQDFGADEGRAYSDLPDLGPLTRAALADHVPPGGESFAEMAARVMPALRGLRRRVPASVGSVPAVAVVAHAGTVRAALGMALGELSLGLAFDISPLSLTTIRFFGDEAAILGVNRPLVA
ncbi:histidine phosphatase family protein [Alphaproteobacteria bacterium GH1-50]|uniref:Histidine phosphatase family protein n=1 Tax=Kangsaoukella pontilimi TaxID=2691042 RepID=A0A7C9ITR4_9RHOB|nr:histidine phosphatase family protein [Kangsaoukella pontilimi]MXQ09045.1 histidine phosphatase family protein [Kangsaoukella pontilimi]